jgi:hypothetical protein
VASPLSSHVVQGLESECDSPAAEDNPRFELADEHPVETSATAASPKILIAELHISLRLPRGPRIGLFLGQST